MVKRYYLQNKVCWPFHVSKKTEKHFSEDKHLKEKEHHGWRWKKKITEIKHPKIMEVRISIPKICWKAYVLSIVLKVRGKNKVLQKLQCKFCSWLLQLQKQCSIRAFTNGESIRNRGKLTEKQQESLEKLSYCLSCCS